MIWQPLIFKSYAEDYAQFNSPFVNEFIMWCANNKYFELRVGSSVFTEFQFHPMFQQGLSPLSGTFLDFRIIKDCHIDYNEIVTPLNGHYRIFNDKEKAQYWLEKNGGKFANIWE